MTETEPRLVDTGRGFTVTYRGKSLYSPADPRAAAVRRAEILAATLEPKTLLFVPSLGLGYGLPELLDRLPESCHILCVEVDERLFKLAVTQGPPLPRSSRLTIIRADRPEQAAAMVHELGPWRFRRVVTVHLCAGYQWRRRAYLQLQQAIETEIRLYWQNKLTLMAMSRLWLKNLITNLRHLPGRGDILELATNRPVLVCGAGPSLEGSLRWIRRVRERVVLMAVDTALPVLAAEDLPPDWVFTLDAQLYTLADFLPYRDPRMKILCDLTSNPRCLRLFPELFFFSTRFHPLRLFDRLEASSVLPFPLPPRGSVGVSAVEAALALTTGPVLFTGLDFSYPYGRTHARGAPLQALMLLSCGRLRPCGMGGFEILLARPRLRLRGKSGATVLTDLVLESYARQLVEINKGCGRSFDLGSEGLPVGARQIRSLAGLIDLCSGEGLGESAGAASAVKARDGSAERWRHRPTAVEVYSFCAREQRLLEEVARGIEESGSAAPELLEAVAYLRLPLSQTGPGTRIDRAQMVQIGRQARELMVRLQHTREAVMRSTPGDRRPVR